VTVMNADLLATALGKPYEHDDVQGIVRQLGLSQVPKAKPKEPDFNLIAKNAGIQLGFIDGDYLAGKKVARYGNADMILYSVTLYTADGEPGYREYRGQLPGGGLISDTLDAHISRLGPPSKVVEDDDEIISRSWTLPGFWLSFAYRPNGALRFAGLILDRYKTLMASK
jgi:hypothetical protein